jgi:RNA-directed DNA polymerase
MPKIRSQVVTWLRENAGLEVSEEKTRTVRSTEGFDFLGFHMITTLNEDQKPKFRTEISRKSKISLKQKIREIVRNNRAASAYSLCKQLSPIIVGWGNYFCYCECAKDFESLNYSIYGTIRAWVFRRKSKGLQSRTDIKLKYFPEGRTYLFQGTNHQDNWVLSGETKCQLTGRVLQAFLPKLTWIKSKTHVKVRDTSSPYDGNHAYWVERLQKYHGCNARTKYLLRQQGGRCALCNAYIAMGDVMEVDHIIPRKEGGRDTWRNLQLVHKHCHVTKTKKRSNAQYEPLRQRGRNLDPPIKI